MNALKTVGIFLIAIGIVMMLVTGINVVTKKKVVDAGPIQIDKKENHPIYWSPVTGGVLLVGGIVVLLVGAKKKVA